MTALHSLMSVLAQTFQDWELMADLIMRMNKDSKIFVAGYDYVIGNWVEGYRYGVIEAVHELCVNDDWGLLYIIANFNESPSFAIK